MTEINTKTPRFGSHSGHNIPKELQFIMEYLETSLDKCISVCQVAEYFGIKENQLEWFQSRYKEFDVKDDRVVNHIPITDELVICVGKRIASVEQMIEQQSVYHEMLMGRMSIELERSINLQFAFSRMSEHALSKALLIANNNFDNFVAEVNNRLKG
jgi:hypothetical protein